MSGSTGAPGQVIGRAETTGAAALTVGSDPIEAARAVRRALAGAKRHAVDVDHLVVASGTGISDDAVRAFARRALGSRGEQVTVAQVVAASGPAAALADSALATLGNDFVHGQGLAIAVGLAADGTTIALCVARGPGPD